VRLSPHPAATASQSLSVQRVKHDDLSVAEAAAELAEAHLGQVYTSATPTGRWSGYCETFAEWAYGHRYGYLADANADYNYWNSRGMIQRGVPP
jgi:hypothetical protein